MTSPITPPTPSPNAVRIDNADSLDLRAITIGSTIYRRATYIKNQTLADWWIPLGEWSIKKL